MTIFAGLSVKRSPNSQTLKIMAANGLTMTSSGWDTLNGPTCRADCYPAQHQDEYQLSDEYGLHHYTEYHRDWPERQPPSGVKRGRSRPLTRRGAPGAGGWVPAGWCSVVGCAGRAMMMCLGVVREA
jgi:hypothetical protein